MPDPVWLYDKLKAAGVAVSELDGARERGHGDMWDIWGVMDHHTGASGYSGPWSIANHPSLGLCSQLFLDRNGNAVVCGVGVAWHGGNGSGFGIKDVNSQLIGIEADNNGTEGWGPKQYWAYVRINAAILNHLGKGSDRSIGHKEWAGAAQGKWDPGGMNMIKFRADIANEQAALRGAKPEVPVIENQINRLAHFSPWLGKRLHPEERPTRSRIKGLYVKFEFGNIYWSPQTGAIAVPLYILTPYEKYDFENGFLGLPGAFHAEAFDDREGVKKFVGTVQGFSGPDASNKNGGAILRKYVFNVDGTVNWGAGEGFAVHGQIGERYAREQWWKGHLGWPTSDEYDWIGERAGSRKLIIQDFENGQLVCDLNGTVSVARGTFVPPNR